MRFRFSPVYMLIILFCSLTAQAEDALDKVIDHYIQQPEPEQAKEEVKLKITRKQAMVIAEQLEVVQALYDLRAGTLANCIEKSVVKPCDSEWVTCVEDAWVVKFEVGSQCSIQHDGRLNVNVLVDGNTGEIRSQYPEVDYFKSKDFCRDKTDCVQVDIKDNNNQPIDKQCFNFVYAQSEFAYTPKEERGNMTLSPDAISEELKQRSEFCACQQNLCQNISSK